MNFNNTLLDSNNKDIQKDKEEIIMNIKNVNINERDYFNKKSILKKQKKSVKGCDWFEHFFGAPKNILNIIICIF